MLEDIGTSNPVEENQSDYRGLDRFEDAISRIDDVLDDLEDYADENTRSDYEVRVDQAKEARENWKFIQDTEDFDGERLRDNYFEAKDYLRSEINSLVSKYSELVEARREARLAMKEFRYEVREVLRPSSTCDIDQENYIEEVEETFCWLNFGIELEIDEAEVESEREFSERISEERELIKLKRKMEMLGEEMISEADRMDDIEKLGYKEDFVEKVTGKSLDERV